LIKRITILLFFSLPLYAFAQFERETDLGSVFAFEMEKDLYRNFSLSFEEEVRFSTSSTKFFERNMATLGIDYSFIDKRLKAGLAYCNIHLYNSKYYFENRHRYYASLSYKHPLGDFILSWRGRFQGTYRNENFGEYKINPKYALRNKIDLEYNIFGSPWRPSVSMDFANTMNDPMGDYFYRIRYQGSVSWRINRTESLDFFLRLDHYIADEDPHILAIGVCFKKKLL
jgi:Protein of unknown function (DUF2490).